VIDVFSQRIWWILVVLWCIIIFGLTASPSSTAKNTGVVIKQATHAPAKQIIPLNIIVRKTAHITLFGVLALLLFNATKYNALLSFLLATTYGASDELHQMFVPNRTPLLSDVAIDSTGVLITLIIASLWIHFRTNKKIDLS